MGPIVGGVIGGILAIILVTFLLWRFWLKKRREEFEESVMAADSRTIQSEKDTIRSSHNRDARASTHTVGSIASTAFTRASNIIQIAYIPGVTNRSMESSPDLMVPPVPPIPAAASSSRSSTPASPSHLAGQERHFFMPRDIRDSTFSGRSGRTSVGASSVAASTYHDNAIVAPVAAQTVTRAKATPVSVSNKSTAKNSPVNSPRSGTPPPMPSLHHSLSGRLISSDNHAITRVASPPSSSINRTPSMATSNLSHNEYTGSERSETPLFRLGAHSNPRRMHSNDDSTFEEASSEDDDDDNVDPDARSAKRLISRGRRSHVGTTSLRESPISELEGSPAPAEMAGSNVAGPAPRHKHKKSSSLNEIIEEATRRATREPRHGGLGSRRKDGAGPFSDAHMARTP